MRHEPIDPKLFVENRARLAALLPPGALAVVHSNDVLPLNADATVPFVQNSDLFYLTGIEQEETALILFPGAHHPAQREILCVQENSDHVTTWEGARLTPDEARAISGVGAVKGVSEFDGLLRHLMGEAQTVYLNLNEHARSARRFEDRSRRFARQCREDYPLHAYARLAPLLHRLRAVKSPIEVDLIRRACAITQAGFARVAAFVKPDVKEFEIEAEFGREFTIRRGGFAYPPIVASGENACVLHYNRNDQTCRKGELVLLDVAAEYANYSSDLTRTLPVSGVFTGRQRDVYEAVLRVLRGALRLLKPGVLLKEYEAEVGRLMEAELIGLKLLDPEAVRRQDPAKPLYKHYYMHGTSHFLGLDTHDVGNGREPLQAGMVLTVEPGIYIRQEKLAVRLENDVLITDSGCEDLMASIPIEPDDIEGLMARQRTR